MLGTSAPHPQPGYKGSVVDHLIGRVTGDSTSGYGWLTLADKPDSVAMRYRYTGSRKN
jgi:hypothetical protein